MAYIYALINKQTLRSIREQKCVSSNYIISATKVNKNKYLEWENIESCILPTINQAKRIAKSLRVPFAGLYMNSSDVSIKKPPALKNLRTLPNPNFDDSGTNLAIIDLVQTRDYYFEICHELNLAIPDFITQIEQVDDVLLWAQAIRKLFNISIFEQYKLGSARQFYLYLRKKIEDNGVFIQSFSGVDISVLRGLSIYFKKMPIIGINDDDYYPAKSFSIIHELVHLIKRQSVECNSMYNSFSIKSEEIFCNAVSGEVLVPQDELKKQFEALHRNDIAISDIEKLSQKFSVSKEVIIRRFLDNGYIDKTTYNQFAKQIQDIIDYEKQKRKELSPGEVKPPIKRIMYREAFDKTSSRLCSAVLKGFSNGILQKQDVSRVIGLDQKHVSNFLAEVSKWS